MSGKYYMMLKFFVATCNLIFMPVFPSFPSSNESVLAKLVSSSQPPVLTDGDGRDDECVPVKQGGGLRWKVSAEVLEEKVFLRLLLVAAFGSHVCGLTGVSAAQLWAQEDWHVGVRGEEGRVSINPEIHRLSSSLFRRWSCFIAALCRQAETLQLQHYVAAQFRLTKG